MRFWGEEEWRGGPHLEVESPGASGNRLGEVEPAGQASTLTRVREGTRGERGAAGVERDQWAPRELAGLSQ